LRGGLVVRAGEIQSEKYDLVVLDEINYVISYHMLDPEKVVAALAARPERVHVICTGRNAHPLLVEAADLVTEMREVKHPYTKGFSLSAGSTTKIFHGLVKREKKRIDQPTPPDERRVKTEGLWTKCESCRAIVWKKDLEANWRVCPKCQHHFRLNATQRLVLLLDSRWVEHDASLGSSDRCTLRTPSLTPRA